MAHLTRSNRKANQRRLALKHLRVRVPSQEELEERAARRLAYRDRNPGTVATWERRVKTTKARLLDPAAALVMAVVGRRMLNASRK